MSSIRIPLVLSASVVSLGVAMAKPVHADPGSEYNDGLATTICKLLVQEHWTPQRVVTELVSSFPREIIANEADGRKMLRWAVTAKCPGAA